MDVGGICYEGSVSIPQEQWTHIAVSLGDCVKSGNDYKSCHLRIFINGFENQVSISPESSASASPATDIVLGADLGQNPIMIGAWPGNDPKLYPFTGLIDNVVLYKKKLTPGEIMNGYLRYP